MEDRRCPQLLSDVNINAHRRLMGEACYRAAAAAQRGFIESEREKYHIPRRAGRPARRVYINYISREVGRLPAHHRLDLANRPLGGATRTLHRKPRRSLRPDDSYILTFRRQPVPTVFAREWKSLLGLQKRR